MAQKKELSQARTILKSGKKIEDAEKLMTGLLKDSANRDNEKVYLVWYQAVQKQYEAANEKLYLKQKQDTAAFLDLTRRMFTIVERLDSLDMRPDKRGRVELEYRSRHAAELSALRPNLFFGGTYYLRKGDNQRAFEFFETYIDCDRQPLFSGYDFLHNDKRMAEAAYWATSSGYHMHDPVLTLRYRHLALADTSKARYTLQYMAEARKWLDDDSLYVETLREGFRRYPTFAYFFPRLMDYYTANRQYDKALALADSALAADPGRELFLFAKSTALLNMGRYAESVAWSDSVIARNDSMPEAYFNAGTAYLNMALKLDSRKDKKQLRATYQSARQYMERYRQLAPDEKRKWGPALYRIYLNLNLGRQFDEIDRLLKGAD